MSHRLRALRMHRGAPCAAGEPRRPPAAADPVHRVSLEQVVTPSLDPPGGRPRAPRARYLDDKGSRGLVGYAENEIATPRTLQSALFIPRAQASTRGPRRAVAIPRTRRAPLCPPRAPAHAPCGSRALARFARILRVLWARPSEGTTRDVLGLREPNRARSASSARGAHEGVR